MFEHFPGKQYYFHLSYRVVQELLNNIMKHAGATEAFVQVIKENKRLNVVVEDNGRGFELESY